MKFLNNIIDINNKAFLSSVLPSNIYINNDAHLGSGDLVSIISSIGNKINAAESAVSDITTQLGTLNNQLEGALNGN